MRQEYLARLEKVQGEIERRVATLKSRKEAQQSSINRLQHEKRGLMETATKLSEAYDDLTVNNQKLSSRLEKVLLNVQQQLPVRSDAELRMQRELLDVERKMKNLVIAPMPSLSCATPLSLPVVHFKCKCGRYITILPSISCISNVISKL